MAQQVTFDPDTAIIRSVAYPVLDMVVAVLKDHPEINFIIYHSAYRGPGAIAKGVGKPVKDKDTKDPQEIPWTSDLLRMLKKNDKIKNVQDKCPEQPEDWDSVDDLDGCPEAD